MCEGYFLTDPKVLYIKQMLHDFLNLLPIFNIFLTKFGAFLRNFDFSKMGHNF